MPSQRSSTARARLVAAVTQEILARNESAPFPISSEHQLCRRFNVSRVTVRLALSDLENRGLIYRKHGKGTFAHGSSSRIHRYLGILIKSPQSVGHRPFAEMIRGAQSVMASMRSAVLLISNPPEIWRPEKASSLGGVLVSPQDVTPRDLDVLKDRNLPYMIFTESNLPGPRVLLGQREAARHMTERLLALGHRRIAFLSGYDVGLDSSKRAGIHEALFTAGIKPDGLQEISIEGDEGATYQKARDILTLSPRPTAIITADDSLGSMVRFQATRELGIKVPDQLSIVSFHDWPYLNYIDPALTTTHFEFFQAGQRAAEALSSAALTGDPIEDIRFTPTYREGQTVGAPPAA